MDLQIKAFKYLPAFFAPNSILLLKKQYGGLKKHERV